MSAANRQESVKISYRGVEAWVTIEDSDALPESYVTVALWHRPRTDGESVPAFTADVRAPDGIDFDQKANRAGDATNAPAHDTEEVTSMPDKRNAVSTISPRASVTWAVWRPTFLGSSLGYLAIRGVVVLRHVTLAEARKRYPDIRIERMPSLG